MSTAELEMRMAWQRHVSTDTRLLDRLAGRHREPHRRYHTATHVAWVLRHLATLSAMCTTSDEGAIVAAALYHDAVYDPHRPDNEHASADLARRQLAELGWATDRIEHVARMIEATAHLASAPAEPPDVDTAILLDADLAVLGAEPNAYANYVTGVRAEYGHLDDAAWRAGRCRVIDHFLAIPRIFVTDAAAERWEARARANLTAERAALVDR
jgi:predicted metal-dependent HD superfamily phosphohydrolase